MQSLMHLPMRFGIVSARPTLMMLVLMFVLMASSSFSSRPSPIITHSHIEPIRNHKDDYERKQRVRRDDLYERRLVANVVQINRCIVVDIG